MIKLMISDAMVENSAGEHEIRRNEYSLMFSSYCVSCCKDKESMIGHP